MHTHLHVFTCMHTCIHVHMYTHTHTHTHTHTADGHSDSSLSYSSSIGGGSGAYPGTASHQQQAPPPQHQPPQPQAQQQNPNSVTYINPLHRSANLGGAEPQPQLVDGGGGGEISHMNGHSSAQQQQQQQLLLQQQQQQWQGQGGPGPGRQPQLPGYTHRYPPPPYNYKHQYVTDRASSEPNHGARWERYGKGSREKGGRERGGGGENYMLHNYCHRSSTSSEQSAMSIPPNFRYSNPSQGTPPIHDDMAARKGLQLTDTRDKKIVNLIAVSYAHEEQPVYTMYIICNFMLPFHSPLIPTVLVASSREAKTT